jgi:hypothetical protein
MTANLLLQLSRPARRRSVADDLLIGSPLVALAVIAAWRFSGSMSAALIVIPGIALLIALAAWRTRRFDQRWLVQQLDARRMDMEDSADLLFAGSATLNPLQQLQRTRLQQRLNTGTAPDLRVPWSSSRIASAWIAGAVGIAALLAWPSPQASFNQLAPSAEDSPVVAGAPRLVAQRLLEGLLERTTQLDQLGLPLERVVDVLESSVVQLVQCPQRDVQVLVVVGQGAQDVAPDRR